MANLKANRVGAYRVGAVRVGWAGSTPAGEVLAAEPGTYALTGEAVGLLAQRVTAAEPGAYELTGTQVNFLTGYGIVAEPGGYTLVGAAVTLKYSGDTSQIISTITARFKPAEVLPTYAEAWTVQFKEE